MNYEKAICKKCNHPKYIVNKTYRLCDDCNYARLHKGKTKYQVANEKQRSKPKKQSKPSGELSMFKEIWEERKVWNDKEQRYVRICVHCKQKLYIFNVWYFAHKKPKSTNPELRLVKSNVDIQCDECHFTETNCGRDIYEKRKDKYINEL